MRTVIVCPASGLPDVSRIVGQLSSLNTHLELWVLGGLGDFPANSTGVSHIYELSFENDADLAEPAVCAQALYELFGGGIPELVAVPSDFFGDELAAQLSLLTGGGCLLNAAEISPTNGGFCCKRAVFAGNLWAEFDCSLPLCLSIYPGGRAVAPVRGCTVTSLHTDAASQGWLHDAEFIPSENTSVLSDADLVVAVGRGAAKKDSLAAVTELASALGGELGGTRPVICEAKLPPERLIGMSGCRVSPEVCLVFGASGSGAFMSGVDGSGLLIAVNKDGDAPIFSRCDCGVVADCGEFAAALLKILEK